jgi:hypothetical protein
MMASDPRFDVLPNEGQAPKQRSKWATCLIGCLAVFGVIFLLVIIAVFWFSRNWRSLAANFGSDAMTQAVDASDLVPQEKADMKVQIDRVATAVRDNKITMEQFGTIFKKVQESPLMPLIVVMGVDKAYLTKSGLSEDEKMQGRIALKRFARGAIDKKIDKEGIDAVMSHVADRRPNGEWRMRQQLSDAELRAALAEAKARADTANVPAEPEDFKPSIELKRIIDEAMPAGE